MFYSIIGILAIILHFIINRKALKRVDVQSIQGTAGLKEAVRYRFFLITVTCFYIFDIAWGFLYEHHDIPALFPVIYSTGQTRRCIRISRSLRILHIRRAEGGSI